MALWSMGASPIILMADLTTLSGADLSTVTNADALAIDQDTLGHAAQRISRTVCGSSYCEVWVRQLSGTNRWALALFNRDSASHSITATWSAITSVYSGFGGAYTTTKDIFLGTSPGTLNASYTPAAIAAHGVTWVVLTP
jgi:alpha-galactosidase